MNIPTPLISVILPLRDYSRHAEEAVRSIIDQTYRPIELVVVDSTADGGCLPEVEAVIATAPAGIEVRIISKKHCRMAESFNTGFAAARGEYLTILDADDRYAPSRLERCLAASKGGGIVVTHITPLDKNGQQLRIGNRWLADYDHVLIHHIAVYPSLSFLSVFMDIVVTPGNLFIPRDVFVTTGPFSDLSQLHYFDFFLRASLHKEPVLIREKLLAHRILSTPGGDRPKQVVNEHAAVIREHLLRLWSGQRPINPLADIFGAHAFMFGQSGWTEVLNKAFDGLLEYRDPPDERAGRLMDRQVAVPFRDIPAEFTLVTHELSLTGAPVIVLELATLLRKHGCLVTVLSLIDGPLKSEFKKRGIKIVTPPLLLDRIARLNAKTADWATRGNRLPERLVHRLTSGLRKFTDWAWQMQLWSRAKGVLVVNSIASWPLTIKLPATWNRPAYWYIHESLDPQWLMPGAHANSQLQRLVSSGRLQMLYGSDATRAHWASNNYDGRVRYWSGVSKTADYLGPASNRRDREKQSDRRVILNIGSISGRKGTRTLIEAFALGRAEGLIAADVELCIVGCARPSVNVEARDIVRRIYQPDLRGHVRLVHNVHPVTLHSYYREADIYAHASIFDCMPIALLTAMAHGLPIVTTDADGCKEAILHDDCGLLVQPGQPRQMAEAIGRLLNAPEKARALGETARARFIERFSVEATFAPLYDTLVEHASAA